MAKEVTPKCPKCKGNGGYETILRDIAGRQSHGLGIEAYVPCDFPGCHNGIVDIKENRRITSGRVGKCTKCGACDPD